MKLHIYYQYDDSSEDSHFGPLLATGEQAVALFRQFNGKAAGLHVVLDECRMISWLQHGDKMFEINCADHVAGRRRLGQVPNAFAQECLRRVFEGDFALDDLERHAFLYYAGAWEPSRDRNYWTLRKLSEWTPQSG
jgi:hypothetical protein